MGEISTSIYAACTVEAVFDGVDIDVSVTIPDPIVVSVDFFTNPASAGVTEHDKLTQESRELPAQHPASAISWGDVNVDEALQSLSINKDNTGVAAGIMSAHLNEYDHSKIGLIDSKENAGVAQSIMDDHLDDYDHDNIPTSNEKAALAGTAGTPSATNKYVTNEDSRITSALQNLYSVYYLSNQNASIPTYKKLVADYSTLQTAIETITVTTSGTDTLVGVWTPNNFGTGERLIPQGLWKYFFRGRVQSTTGKKDAAIVTKLYKRNTLGVETFITESLPSPILSDVISIIRVDTPISEIILTTDEILVGKIYAREVGGLGGSPTVEFQYANDTGTRVEAPSVGFHNHNESLNRDADDCHPISAITNLQETFDALPTTTASDTPASIATYNDYSLWLDENLKLHLIYNDGDSRQIVQVNGLRGAQGETGATGLQGIQGIKGDKGDQGVQGIQGVPGSDATVTKANVEAVLTGEITTHTHPGSGGLSQAQILALINLGTL